MEYVRTLDHSRRPVLYISSRNTDEFNGNMHNRGLFFLMWSFFAITSIPCGIKINMIVLWVGGLITIFICWLVLLDECNIDISFNSLIIQYQFKNSSLK